MQGTFFGYLLSILIAAVIGLGLWGGPLVSFLKDVATGVTF